MRRALVSFLLLLSGVVASAQMTEDKIIQYVQEQQAKGVPQEQIVFELNKKGVTVQQLQQMRQKYEKQQSTGVMGNTMPTQSSVSRTRTVQQGESFNMIRPAEQTGMTSTVVTDSKTLEKEKLQSMYDESMFLFVRKLNA